MAIIFLKINASPSAQMELGQMLIYLNVKAVNSPVIIVLVGRILAQVAWMENFCWIQPVFQFVLIQHGRMLLISDVKIANLPVSLAKMRRLFASVAQVLFFSKAVPALVIVLTVHGPTLKIDHADSAIIRA